MRDFIVFVGIKAWALIADGWRPLVESEKFFEENQRLVSFGTRVSQWNFKALHIFLMGISEFRRISTCEYAREACDILKNTRVELMLKKCLKFRHSQLSLRILFCWMMNGLIIFTLSLMILLIFHLKVLRKYDRLEDCQIFFQISYGKIPTKSHCS